jgi:hypothetical protein
MEEVDETALGMRVLYPCQVEVFESCVSSLLSAQLSGIRRTLG